MPFAAEEPARRVEPDPTRARQIHLAPRMQIDDVARDPARLVGQHALVGELHEIPRHEARREPASAKQRRHEHRRITAARPPGREALFGCVDPGLFADDVAHASIHRRVERDQQIGRRPRTRDLGVERLKARTPIERRIIGHEKRRQLARQLGRVRERHLGRELLEQEVERVHGPNVDRQLDQHIERAHERLGREMHARHVVPVRVLLPAQAVLLLDLQPIRLDARARVRGRPQPNRVRPERGRRRIAVVALVLDQQPHSATIPRSGFRRVSRDLAPDERRLSR